MHFESQVDTRANFQVLKAIHQISYIIVTLCQLQEALDQLQ